MKSLVRLVVLVAFTVLVPATLAHALLFEDARPEESGGRAILWARNCGTLARDRAEKRQCAPFETQFSDGDSVRLENKLASRKRSGKGYDEVWLYSGGGLSNEGFLVGRVLRKYQMTVRIRSGALCASACTVAFLGAWFRYIDPGGTYHVHSASAWANGFDCGDATGRCLARETLEKIKQNPAQGFASYASEEQIDARFSARRRLVHFQNTLLQPVGEQVREGSDVDKAIAQWAETYTTQLTYPGSAQHRADVERFLAEGEPAAQDILMRLERDSMRNAISDLRAILPQLGRRAEPALRMIEVMFQTSILETAILSEATLLKMGFITREIEVAK